MSDPRALAERARRRARDLFQVEGESVDVEFFDALVTALLAAEQEKERLREALEAFADPRNYGRDSFGTTLVIGILKPVEFASAALAPQPDPPAGD